MTELEQRLLDTIERMDAERREEVRVLRRSMRDLSERVTSLAGQVEGLSALLERVAGR